MHTFASWFGRLDGAGAGADTAVGADTKGDRIGPSEVGNLRTSAGPDSSCLTPNESRH